MWEDLHMFRNHSLLVGCVRIESIAVFHRPLNLISDYEASLIEF